MFKNLFGRDQERDAREKKLNETVTGLMRTVESQRRLIMKHESHIADIGNQNEELRKSITITPQQKKAYDEQTNVLIGYKNNQDRLAVWLRNNKAVEIAAGKHRGLDLIDVVLMYLGGTNEQQGSKVDERPN